MNILILIIILLVLVLVHEFGHFFVAKKFGIRVDEFGFGFPPKLFGIKKGETEYSINALPFGGFVKIFGENPDEENTVGIDSSRSFVNKPKYVQALVLFAGVFMNFILAWFLFSITFFSGSPLATDSIPMSAQERMTTKQLVILGVKEESPAFKAGLVAGDIIVSAKTEEKEISNASVDDFISFINQPGENINITYTRNRKEFSTNIVPLLDESLGRAVIGIAPNVLISGKFNIFESINYGLQTASLTYKDTLLSFGKLFIGGSEGKAVRESVIGPVGLVSIVGVVNHIGIGYLISFAGLISVSLAVINLIPFPALDGGRLLFILIEKIKGSRINSKVANITNMIGFGVLILLMILITYNDVLNLF